MYKGDFINHKKDGIGFFIQKNGDYYIGQFKDDLRNGKGTLYSSNGKIKQEGNWVFNVFIGN